MAVFKVDVQKVLVGEFWTNRYLVEAADLAAAIEVADDIVGAERVFHTTEITFDRFRVSTVVEGDDLFSTVPLGVTGQKAPNGALLPLFNTVRADFPAGFGRPSRKYYRGVLGDGDTEFTTIAPATGALVFTGLQALAALPLVDPQGTALSQGVVIGQVQIRQLRRGSRRRTNPVI